jgi:hypothetical protein
VEAGEQPDEPDEARDGKRCAGFAGYPGCSPDMEAGSKVIGTLPRDRPMTAWTALGATTIWLLGLVVALGLGTAVMMLGLSLSGYDAERNHIPGHFLYRAFVTMPGLVQLAYLVPLYHAARRRRYHSFAWGLCVGAGLVITANGALAWLGYAISQID